MKTHGSNALFLNAVGVVLLLLLSLVPTSALAASSLFAQVGDGMIYLQWHAQKDPAGSFVLYRSKDGGQPKQLAEIVPLTDFDRASALLREGPDALSRGLTLKPDFIEQIKARPELDQALILASAGYARLRGLAYLDLDISRKSHYHYSLVIRSATGSETLIGETKVDGGQPTVLPAPVVWVAPSDESPTVIVSAVSLVRYHVERVDQEGGPWQRVTLLPIVGKREGEMLRFEDHGAPADGRSYYYRVASTDVFDTAGTVSAVIAVTTQDRTPPSAPTVDNAASEPAAALLSWRAGSEADLAGYHVYRRPLRATAGADGRLAVEAERRLTQTLLAANVTRFRDADVIPGRIYQYQLTAVDRNGNESKHSPPVLARPRDTVLPAAPRALKGRADESGRVSLSWDANTEADLYVYRLYRGVDDGELSFVRELPAGKSAPGARISHTETVDVNSEAVHRYALSAVDATENESALSETVQVSLPDRVAPAAPIITAVQATDGGLVVTWQPSPARDIASYHLHRGESPDKLVRISKQALPADTYVYRDAAARPGQVWYYAVGAVDRSGNLGALSEARSGSTYAALDPQPPKSLALEKSGNEWWVTWKGVTASSGYVMYVSEAPEGRYAQFGTLSTSPGMQIQVPQNTTHWYRVQTVYATGAVSALSEPLAVAPVTDKAKP